MVRAETLSAGGGCCQRGRSHFSIAAVCYIEAAKLMRWLELRMEQDQLPKSCLKMDTTRQKRTLEALIHQVQNCDAGGGIDEESCNMLL